MPARLGGRCRGQARRRHRNADRRAGSAQADGYISAVPGFYVLLSQLYVRAGRLDEAGPVLEMAAGSTVRPCGMPISNGCAGHRGGLGGGRGGVPVELGHCAPPAGGLFMWKRPSSAGPAGTRGRRKEADDVLEECLAQRHEGEDVGTVCQAA